MNDDKRSEQKKALYGAIERFRIAKLRYYEFLARAGDPGESNNIPASYNDECRKTEIELNKIVNAILDSRQFGHST